MALWEDLFTEAGWGTMGLIGLGSILFAPTLKPMVETVVRPVLKGVIWSTLAVTDTVRHVVADVQEQVGAPATEAGPEAAPSQETHVTPPEAGNVTAAMGSALAASPVVTPEGKSGAEK